MITPTVGRIVLYCLSEQDVIEINRRRTTGSAIADRIDEGTWPVGVQAHVGNSVRIGDVLPAIVVKVWSENMINIRVMLDGSDELWATSRSVSEEATPGYFHWIPYQKGQAAKTEALEAKLQG